MPEKDHAFPQHVSSQQLKERLEKNQRRGQKLRAALRRVLRSGKRLKRWVERAQKREHREPAGIKAANAYAFAHIGVTESPPGSNRGVLVDIWTRFLGYNPPVFWCGCFAGFVACKIGGAAIPNVNRLGYHLNIVNDARAHANGLVAVPASEARAGDIVAYSFAHIGYVVGPTVNGLLHTIEGNTSSTTGQVNNGGMVAEHHRPVSDVLQVARPTY